MAAVAGLPAALMSSLPRQTRTSSVAISRRRLSLLSVSAKALAEQMTYLEAERYRQVTVSRPPYVVVFFTDSVWYCQPGDRSKLAPEAIT